MLIRYPGGKGKLAKRLVRTISRFLRDNPMSYREPFAGSLAIGSSILTIRGVSDTWFNDIDYGIYALWITVKNDHKRLIDLIKNFNPSIEKFYEYKKYLKNIPKNDIICDNDLSVGFKKLAIHQMSFSGLGTMSGGPLGGKSQSSDYKIDCRWSPGYMIKNILKLNELMRFNDTHITYIDFENVIDNERKSFIYLDPPYYEKGPELYQYAFNEDDHVRLASNLRYFNGVWLLSYDDNPRIRELYDFADIVTVPLNYSISGTTNKMEILIASKKYSRLLEEKQEISVF